MFQHFNNIESAFRYVRLFTIVVVATCTALCGYCVYMCMSAVSKAADRIYLLSGGQAFTATAASRKDNIPVEARDHVRVFHEHFFTLSPDEKAISATMEKALNLADRSAKMAYANLKEKGYYNQIISGDVSQKIECDSIQLNMRSYPYMFRYYGKQRIIRPSAIVTRSLITEGFLRSIDRSEDNSHGFLIERWVTIANNDILHQKR